MSTLLDDFNRANSANLGSNWSLIGAGFGITDFAIDTNQIKSSGTSFEAWNANTWADFDVEITVTARPSDGQRIELSGRLVNTSNLLLTNGYALRMLANAGTDDMIIGRVDNNATFVPLQTTPMEIVAGYKYRLRMIGTSLQAFYNSGSGWTAINIPVTDTTYSAAGYLGLTTTSTSTRLDDFVGGAPATATPVALDGSTTLTFTPTGALTVQKPLAGNTALTFTPTGTISVSKPLGGSTSVVFTPIGDLSVTKPLAGSASLVFATSGELTVAKLLSGATGINFSGEAALTVLRLLAGQSILSFETLGDVTVAKPLAGSTMLNFTATGNISIHHESVGTPPVSRTIIIDNAGRGIIVLSTDERSIVV